MIRWHDLFYKARSPSLSKPAEVESEHDGEIIRS